MLVIGHTPIDNAFICGLLNSDFMQRCYVAMFGSLSLAGGYLRFGAPQVRELPIPKVSKTERDLIAKLVYQRMAEGSINHAEIERRINDSIWALFDSVGG